MNRFRWYKTAVVAMVALLLSACASAPKIQAIYEPGLNLSEYKSFAFLESLDPQGEHYLTLQDRYLRDSIARQMLTRGFVEGKDSSLIVAYRVSTKEKISSTSIPIVGGGLYEQRGPFGYGFGMASETQIRQYTEGTLIIDIVDRANKQMIWQGVAVGRVKDLPSENMKAEIDGVIKAIFEKFPNPNTPPSVVQ